MVQLMTTDQSEQLKQLLLTRRINLQAPGQQNNAEVRISAD
jgi:hypothetical protein